MGFIRGALVTIFAIVLLISLFLMNASLTLSWSLDYDSLKPALKDSVKELAQDYIDLEEVIEDALPLMEVYCQNKTEYVFSQEGYTFVIPCEILEQGSGGIVDYGLDYLIESIYYQEYTCEFWDCVRETDTPLVLISEKARDYWKSKFYMFFLISLALFVLIFFVSKHKNVAFIIGGFLIILSSLPFIKLNWILSFVPENFVPLFESFFTRAYNVFLIMFIIGLVLLGLGVAFHFFHFGMKIFNWFSKKKDEEISEEKGDKISKKEVKKIVKEEVKKKSK